MEERKERIEECGKKKEGTEMLLAKQEEAQQIGEKEGYHRRQRTAGYEASNRRPVQNRRSSTAWSEPKLVGYGLCLGAGH